jgi:WhiB family redox-sensing transcriptional regulator
MDLAVEQDLGWQAFAACKVVPEGYTQAEWTDVFFPGRGAPTMPLAQKVCSTCPVQEECLDFGLAESFGVWGGLGERPRTRIRRSRDARNR